MNNNDYWKLFEQTGAILYYLNYTACTSEASNRKIEGKVYTGSSREGGVSGCSKFDWNGIIRNASR